MIVVKDIASIKKYLRDLKLKRKIIGFVPTMGALHKGHLTLIRKARQDCDVVVVSIFVNPTQFGQDEDFERYPRDLSRDLKLCEAEGVDFLFVPSEQEMYPQGFSTWVEVGGRLTQVLEGASRPGHFKGVSTVVAKLFNIIFPDRSYFGEKDYQQALVIKKMVRELNFDTEIELVPTVREKDGLACSSRNSYLSPEERKAARILYQSLIRAKTEIQSGEDDASRVLSLIEESIQEEPLARIDYIALVDPETLEPVEKIEKEILLALAVKIGKVRLIDNMRIGVRS